MSDLVISWLRGVVPAAWSALVTVLLGWAAVHVPWVLDLLELLNIDLQSTATVTFVMGLVFAAWLALWRRIEPHVPDWLSRIAMGSAKTPLYISTGEIAAVAPQGSTITVDGEPR